MKIGCCAVVGISVWKKIRVQKLVFLLLCSCEMAWRCINVLRGIVMSKSVVLFF